LKIKNTDRITDFLFEVGMLAKIPRSGFFFLGSGKQSVAEHINRTVYLGFVLGSLARDVDMLKIMKMCLFHDITESRISDLNYVNQKYVDKNESKALRDLSHGLPFGKDIRKVLEEYEEQKNREAILVEDADNLEMLLSLKEQLDTGNIRAKTWIPQILKRLISDEAKIISKSILETDSDHWWYGEKDDSWWVDRDKK